MISRMQPNRSWVCSSLLAFLGILGLSLGTIRGEDANQSLDEINALNKQWERAFLQALQARRNAKSPNELERVQKDFSANEQRLVERCVNSASRQPESIAGLIALKLVACRSPETEEGKKAAEALVKQAASADLDVLAEALDVPHQRLGGPCSSGGPDHSRASQEEPWPPASGATPGQRRLCGRLIVMR